jgi:Asp-tRNA(Asn)/Glu-tRNA(Gln) amidotransferase A subunit family amidase
LQTIADVPADLLVPPGGLRPSAEPVFGLLGGLFDRLASDDVREMMERFCEHLTGRGARIERVALPASFEDVIAQHRIVMAVEAAHYHEERLRRRPEDYPPKIASLLEEGLRCPAQAYARAKALQADLRDEMAGALAGYAAVLCPATTGGAPDAATTGDPAFNSPWSFTGLPVVSIPTGLDRDGLPLGVQLVGSAYSEADLFAVAAWCEANRETEIGDPPL